MAARITSIESLRVLAILGVILLHTDVLGRLQRLGDGRVIIDITLYLVWWVSLPYFFIVAGFFFGKSGQTHGNHLDHLRRYISPLAWIFLAWLCIYIIIPNNWPGEVREHGLWRPFYTEALKNLRLLGTQDIRVLLAGNLPVWHLWFLPALIVSLTTLTLFARYRLQRHFVPLVVSLYVLALVSEVSVSASHQELLGVWSISILFTAVGWWQAGRELPSMANTFCLIVGGYAFALMEGMVLKDFFHSSPSQLMNHYYFGGIVLAIGIFLLALAKPNLGQSTPLPFLAQFTLGVYVSHILIIYTLPPINWRLQNLFSLWPFSLPLAVYFLATLFTLVLSKVPIARYLVSRPPSEWLTQYQDRKPTIDKIYIPDSNGGMPQLTINRGLYTADGLSPAPFRYGPCSQELTRMCNRLGEAFAKCVVSATDVGHKKSQPIIDDFAESFAFKRSNAIGTNYL